MTSRIEKLAFRMSQWSGNHVQVGGDVVYVNAQPVVRPVPSGDYSPRRRAFLAAGNLARVTHNEYGEAIDEDKVQAVPLNQQDEKGKKAHKEAPIYPPAWNVARQGSDIYVNGLRIMTCAPVQAMPVRISGSRPGASLIHRPFRPSARSQYSSTP